MIYPVIYPTLCQCQINSVAYKQAGRTENFKSTSVATNPKSLSNWGQRSLNPNGCGRTKRVNCVGILETLWKLYSVKAAEKRNFSIWDFCLIIKFELYLETLPFLLAYGKRKLLFQSFEIGFLSPKLAAILARPKHPPDAGVDPGFYMSDFHQLN